METNKPSVDSPTLEAPALEILAVDEPQQGEAPQAISAAPEQSLHVGGEAPSTQVSAPLEAFAFEDIVSGRFDQTQEAPDDEALPTKRVLQPQPESPKLHKILAQAGLGSRLEMEDMINEGRISVNNEPAHIGQRIQLGDQIKVNGKPIKVRMEPPPLRVIAYHKPAGEIVTHDDPQNRPTVFRKLPKLHQGKWQSVGRLDLNTEGLLLFTSSGELTNKLTHPRFGLEREYAVRVLGALNNEEKQKLLDGVQLDDGTAQFGSIVDGGGEGANCWYRVTISEGRNREVRRMIESLGHAVSRLIRIRYGSMMLPKGLKRGAWMELDEADCSALIKAAGGGQERKFEADGMRNPRNNRRRRGGRGGSAAQGSNPPNNGGTQNGAPPRAFKGRDERVRGVNRSRSQGGQGGDQGGARNDGFGTSHDADFGGDDRADFLPRGINPAQTATDLATQRRGSGGGFGRNRGGRGGGGNSGGGGGNGGQPDPMRTSMGYIGQDSLNRQRRGR